MGKRAKGPRTSLGADGSHLVGSAASAPAIDFPVVGIGASAGGMETFVELLRHIPPDSGMAFVLIQHLNPTHASYLSEAVARATNFPVHEIQDGMHIARDHVYVIPPDSDVSMLKGALSLLPRPADERRPHLPIDFFFRTMADDLGNRAIGVVLSGTGSDGSEGLRAIEARDGVTFAQDPGTAKFRGMPEAAVKTGAVDFILPIPELATELLRIGRHPFVRQPDGEALAGPEDARELTKVFVLLRSAVGVDFSEYKASSIRRRMARRMALRRVNTVDEYVRQLRDDRAEVQSLFEDVMIHVTSFFRDGDAFEKLKEHVFPDILSRKREGEPIRIWSAGCSTGEEAYSLLIVLLEFFAQRNVDVPIQVFGTDVSEKVIEQARAGFYPDAAVADVGAERLARFFTKVDGGGYRIAKAIRDRCAFVKHDLASDPPFSKLDLIGCRNVLIYFGQELQKRALATFHFALNEPGFLLLGRAENIAQGTSLFRLVDEESKIFARTAAKSVLRLGPPRDRLSPPAHAVDPGTAVAGDVIRRTESLLLDQYAPPGVVVNERMEILHFRGRTGPYLEPTPGQPRHDLIKMARKGLVADLRIALAQAKSGKTTVRRSGVSVDDDGSTRTCDVIAIPITLRPESREDVYAVLFEEQRRDGHGSTRPAAPLAASEPGAGGAAHLARLEDELKTTKDYLQSIIDEHQRANEELLSANEELVSSNEELQSLNEELETAKEELQSTNEELSTLNEELHTRNEELNVLNSDLFNILGSVEVPIVIVDGARRIRRFTPKARPILNLLPSDVGRPIDDIKPSLDVEKLDQKIADVIDTVTPHEEEVQGRDGRWFRLQIRPYTTVDKRIDGAVVSVIDIDLLRRALSTAEYARDYAKATVEAVQVPLVVFDSSFDIVSANAAFEGRYGLSSDGGRKRSIREFLDGVTDHPGFCAAVERVRERNESFQRLELACELPRLGQRSLSLSGHSVTMPDRGPLVLLALEDVTEHSRAEAERASLLHETEVAKASAEEANRMKDVFLATLSHELRTPLSSLLLQAQLMRKVKVDDPRVRRWGETIERGVRTQAQLIDDLLDVSRVATGKLKMEVQVLALPPIVQAAVDAISPIAEKKRVGLDVRLDESLPPLSGDPLRLQQVVSNLLTNSVKFTPEGGRVSVALDSAEGKARLRVTDNGVGIEPAFLPHLFDRFAQEDGGQSRAQGGLGLGLAIVRYLVEAHGGSVHAQSPGRGQGAAFTVLLPLMEGGDSRAPAGPGPPSEKSAASIQSVRILVVDDDPGTREALAEMLPLYGAEVTTAGSAATAFARWQKDRPQLMICDIAMPDEDGYSLMARIRALGPERGGVRAVALTALATQEDRRRALDAGFGAHMAKPVDLDRLVSVLAELLARA